MTTLEWLKRLKILRSLEGNAEAVCFTFVWGWFELEIKENKSFRQIAQDNEENVHKEPALFDAGWKHFRGRYMTDGDVNYLFRGLFEYAGSEKRKITVENAFNQTNPEYIDKTEALLCIIYQLRNNFFHGPKLRKKHIEKQRGNFCHANKILRQIIDWNRHE